MHTASFAGVRDAARQIAGKAVRTPLIESPALNTLTGGRILEIPSAATATMTANLNIPAGASATVESAGLWEVQNDAGLTDGGASGARPLPNPGTFHKRAGRRGPASSGWWGWVIGPLAPSMTGMRCDSGCSSAATRAGSFQGSSLIPCVPAAPALRNAAGAFPASPPGTPAP